MQARRKQFEVGRASDVKGYGARSAPENFCLVTPTFNEPRPLLRPIRMQTGPNIPRSIRGTLETAFEEFVSTRTAITTPKKVCLAEILVGP